MFYSIRHFTKFRYTSAVSESVMEVRMHPRSEGPQRCLNFELEVTPRVRVNQYRDYLGNIVHHFNVPGAHRQLTIIAEAMVDVTGRPSAPQPLGADGWERLDAEVAAGDFWEFLTPSLFARWTPRFEEFAAALGVPSREEARRRDPWELVNQLSTTVHREIAYVPKSTRVDSSLDEALENRRGVCQDQSHLLIALIRRVGIPCRYVSGYLFRQSGDQPHSAESATHAWVEVYLPTVGWLGLDPTNHVVADDRHVRTAVGRDYTDVPPTRGVFKGDAASELTVAVRVAPSDKAPPPEAEMESEDWSSVIQSEPAEDKSAAAQQQQQQQ